MKIDIEKIQRFKEGQFSMNDYVSVKEYFSNINYHTDIIKNFETEEDVEDVQESQVRNYELILDKIHHKIRSQENKRRNRIIGLYNSFSKIAAVLLLPALITSAILFYFLISNTVENTSLVEIHSPAGARTHFVLPDGSKGWLNSNSSIKYQVNFAKNRKVKLKGEAWFDVEHDKSNKFVVQTGQFDINVLGTQFNALAYENTEITEVILEEGEVLVTGKNGAFSRKIKPDQILSYNKSNRKFKVKQIDASSYSAWKDGLLIFRNVPMSKLAERLERRFNTDIVLHGVELQNMVIRATFEDENLEDILKLISIMEPIKYKVHNRHKLSDDTFSRNKIEIWLKK